MVKATLIRMAGIPYGGSYRLDVPERGLVGNGIDFEHLVESIEKYRKANAVPVGLGLQEEIEREICLRYPAECKEGDPRVPSADVRLDYSDVFSGTLHMMSFVAAGRPHVAEDEALRRAAICVTCPFLRHFTKPCGGLCGPLLKMVSEIVGTRTTRYDSRLDGAACGICKCNAKAIIHVPLKYQVPHLSDFQKEQYQLAGELHQCWKSEKG